MPRFIKSDGIALLRLARDAIERNLSGRSIEVPVALIDRYSEKAGAFVTLNLLNNGREELRGCIGFPMPDKPLYKAVIDAAISSTRDPRFEKVRYDEMNDIILELSILTNPELIQVKDPREYPEKIKVGRDGLMVRWRYGSGLLLPQVAVEYKWDEERFLCETCMKAGAMPDCWLYNDTKVYRFEAVIFKEVTPRGEIIEIDHNSREKR